MEQRTAAWPHPVTLVLWGVAGVGLYAVSLSNYLLFHALAEGFSIVVAVGVFMIAWNARRFLEHDYLLFLGTAYVFVAGVDVVHTLAYRGMGVFAGDEANTATQLWIAARYLQSLSLLVAPLYIRRRVRVTVALAGYATAVTVLLLAIFAWRIFPDCFVPGSGLTPFKTLSEYLIAGILGVAMVGLLRQRTRFDRRVLTWLLWSIGLTIGSEVALTFYVSVYGLSNFIGHGFKILAFYLIYAALIDTGLSRPYALLFRNLKQSEETLRASEQRYRGLVEMSPDAVCINRNERLVYANPAALGLFGASTPDQLLGKSPYALFHPDYHPGLRARLRRLLAGAPVPLIETQILQVDGAVRPVEVVASSFVDRDGPAIQVILRDITARTQAEAALRESEERLRLLGDNLPESAVYQYAHEPDGRIRFLYVSAGIERLNGVRVQDVLRDAGTLHRQIPPEDFTRLVAAEQRSAREQADFDLEVPMRRPDGQVRWMRLHSRPRLLPDGRVVWDGVQTDVTARKQAEEALRRASEALEHRVQERTAELSQAVATLAAQAGQLRVLTAEVTVAEQRERRRLADVLHDGLQQLLVATRLRAYMLGRSPDAAVQAGAHELVALLEEAIAQTRSLAGELSPPALQTGHLRPALEWLARWMWEKHQLTVHVRPTVAPLAALPVEVAVLLYQAVRELLLNAVKYAQVPAVAVTVTPTATALTCTVADAGVGFDPTTLRVVGGTEGGFGLLGIRERLELLGGRLDIASAPGQGSRFTLTVPLPPAA